MRQIFFTLLLFILLAVSCEPSVMRNQSVTSPWTKMLTSRNFFLSISFGDERHGIVTGVDERILLTSDGGNTWSEHTIRGKDAAGQGGVNSLVKSVMTASGQIYVLGHLEDASSGIHVSSNRGMTWKIINYPNSSLNGIDGVGDQSWIVGTINSVAVVLHSKGQGTWQQVWRGSTQQYLNAVDFINADTGWAVGANGLIIHTVDGGYTWNVQPTPSKENLESVAFANVKTGYAVGHRGVIFYTSDGGNTWIEQKSSTQATLTSVIAINPNVAWAVGQSGTVLYTDDAGQNWRQQDLGTQADTYAIAVKDSEIWIATSDGTILRSPKRR
jgi:photosystem II stability/assembly factor-like uncharacterized protein